MARFSGNPRAPRRKCATTMSEFVWRSIRLYYFELDKDDLLLDCVRPILATLRARGWARRAYFIRHWEGGPHIRLQVEAAPETFERDIIPFVTHEADAYFRARPSRSIYTEEDALREHQRHQRMTDEPLPYAAPAANNSIALADYDSRAAAIGSAGTAGLLEDFYVETNDLVFEIIERTRGSYPARFNASFDQLVAVAAASSRMPLTRAYISYRSHSEAYIVSEPQAESPAARQQRFHQMYLERRDTLLRRFTRLLSQIDTAPEQLPSWLAGVIAAHHRYFEAALQGTKDASIGLRKVEDAPEDDGDERPYLLDASEFHKARRANEAAQKYLMAHPIMIAFRIMLNFLYLHLSRTGMLNNDRYVLDYYIAEVVEEVFHISAVDIISSYTGAEQTPAR